MINRIKVYERTEKEQEDHYLAEWAFDSHNWNETMPGYFVCAWCGAGHTSTTRIDIGYPLCEKNPILKSFRFL